MNPLLRRLIARYMAPEGDGAGGGGGGGGGSGSGQGGGGQGTPNSEPATFSREYVSELRHENAGQRKARQEAEARATTAEEAAKKATEEAKTQTEAAKKAADERILRAELKAEALKAGMVDLDGLKLADLSKVKLNDKGEVEGAAELMAEMKKAKPYLFGSTASTSNPKGDPPKPNGDPKAKLATEMSKEEYAEARKNIARGILPKATA